MNIIPFKSFPVLIFTALACSLPVLPSVSRADTLINESFNAPLETSVWGNLPKGSATSSEGVLTLTGQGPADKSAFALIGTAVPSELLNFTKHQVEIRFTDLVLGGDTAPENRVFIVALTSDSNKAPAGNSELRLRISGAGNIMLGISENDNGVNTSVFTWNNSVVLPLKNVKLALTPSGASLAVEDAGGAKSWNIPFTAPLTKWTNASPTLRLQIQRQPAEGDVKASLQGLKVESLNLPAK